MEDFGGQNRGKVSQFRVGQARTITSFMSSNTAGTLRRHRFKASYTISSKLKFNTFTTFAFHRSLAFSRSSLLTFTGWFQHAIRRGSIYTCPFQYTLTPARTMLGAARPGLRDWQTAAVRSWPHGNDCYPAAKCPSDSASVSLRLPVLELLIL